MNVKLNDDALAALKYFEAQYAGAAYDAIELLRITMILAETHTQCLHKLSDIADYYADLPDSSVEELNSGNEVKAPSSYEVAQRLLASANRMRKNWKKPEQKGDEHGNDSTD